jgi:saccharopine dehydrogenase-like NADP-dependent oxidoreductase
MKIVVLGAGLVGGPMAADLVAEPGFEVGAADIDPSALARLKHKAPVRTIGADLSDPAAVRNIVKDFDLVLSAVPGFMGFATLRAVLEAGKNTVDISFFPEDPFGLDALAREKGVTAVIDCGVAPGMSNILIGRAQFRLDAIASVLIYVGGLPEVREWPYDYKAGFSPADVIEEYTRPARYIQNGAIVVRPALSEPEFLDFPGIGTLEAFNTDGLRTLIGTIPAPDMKEKTLRYPGHIEKMAMLRETGFFSQEEIEVNGARVRPRDVTAKLLFPKWKMGPADRDITIMRVIVEGTSNGARRRFTSDLLDRFDPETGVHSMARTTGYTATMAVRMLAWGLFARKGIIAPELIGREPECVAFLLEGLERRGVIYNEMVEEY